MPAAALAMAEAAEDSAPSGQSATAQRPPVYRASDAIRTLSRGHAGAGVKTQKSGGRKDWFLVGQQLQSPREAAVAPRPARRQQQSRKGARALSRSSMRSSHQSDRAARTRASQHVGGTIVTPNLPAGSTNCSGEGNQQAGLRMRARIGSGRRPGSAGLDLAPATTPDESVSDLVSAENLLTNTVKLTQHSADAPQCPLHCDCRLPPGHSGFCRFQGPREE
eukprot:COSAG02_NODE_21651_length_780_cov_0.958884_1_plen_220_part_10